MPPQRFLLPRLGATLVLLLAVTAGCAFPVGSVGAPSSDSSSKSSAGPNAGLLTGTTMSTFLTSKADAPQGYQRNASYTRDSGDTFGPPSHGPFTAAKACDKLRTTVWSSSMGIGSAGFAQNDYQDSYSDEFAQEIDAYRGNGAHTVMSRLAKTVSACGKFTTTFNKRKVTVTVKRSMLPGPGLSGTGDEAVVATVTSPAWQGGQTNVAVRVGRHVVSVLYTSSKEDKGAAAVDMATDIAKEVAAET